MSEAICVACNYIRKWISHPSCGGDWDCQNPDCPTNKPNKRDVLYEAIKQLNEFAFQPNCIIIEIDSIPDEFFTNPDSAFYGLSREKLREMSKEQKDES